MSLPPPLPEFLPSHFSFTEMWDAIAPSFPPQLRRQFEDRLRPALGGTTERLTVWNRQ